MPDQPDYEAIAKELQLSADRRKIENEQGKTHWISPGPLMDRAAAALRHAAERERELVHALERCRVLKHSITIREVLQRGDDAIEAAGLDPWCINEGLADGSETLDLSFIDRALRAARTPNGGE